MEQEDHTSDVNDTVVFGTKAEPTELTTFEGGEFIRVDIAGSETAVVWSTASNLRDILQLVMPDDISPSNDVVAVLRREEDTQEISVPEAIAAILADNDALILEVWVPFDGFTFSWGAATNKRIADAAMIYPNNTAAPNATLIERTGTSHVGQSARTVLARSTILTKESTL